MAQVMLARAYRTAVTVAALLCGAAAADGATAQESRTWPDWLSPCSQDELPRRALCGKYEVWEDRDAAEGRRIGLNVLLIPAANGVAHPDPVVRLAGGPGVAATDGAGRLASALKGLAADRDLLFIDQRGTGESHGLWCPNASEGGPAQTWFQAFQPAEAIDRCLAALDADVRWYTTPVAMDDLEEVRRALGYGRLNLFGGSYGTRAALVYLKRHPESVRTAVLKGVAPVNLRSPAHFDAALEAGVDWVVRACADDGPCREAFPDVRADYLATRQRLEAGPVAARVTVAPGRKEEVSISRGVFADGLRHILYSTDGAATVPRLLRETAEGHFDRFAQAEYDQAQGFDRILAGGMFLTVTCSEDVAFLTDEQRSGDAFGGLLGDYRVRRQMEACRRWPAGKWVDDSYVDPPTADVPVLLISGEFDTATPPTGAHQAAAALPDAIHVLFPNQSHDYANPSCELDLTVEFIRSGGDRNQLDLSCVSATRRKPFVVGGGR